MSKGFTLIELLVVVAIIGVLASVVISSLNTARAKAADSKLKQQLNNMRAEVDFYTGVGNEYPLGVCAITADTLFDSANSGLGHFFENLDLTNTLCYAEAGQPSSGMAWAIAFQTSTGAWCVDSSGSGRDIDSSGNPYTTTLSSALTGTSCL